MSASASLVDPALCALVLAYLRAGRSPLPIAPGGKSPALITARGERVNISWDAYQHTAASPEQVVAWFPPDRLMGVGIVMGQVSGNLVDGVQHGAEVLDVDDAEILEQFLEAANWQGLGELLHRLLFERTPRGSGHLAYQCPSWEGNIVLARRPGDVAAGEPQAVTLIETRGEGGQAVVAPTPPGVHPQYPERGYELLRGSWEDLPVITPEERQALFELARSFNSYIPPERLYAGQRPSPARTDGNRPGDWVNRVADRPWWRTLLEPHGWTLVHERGEIAYWRRPGKDGTGCSATLGACGQYFYCFSSNASPFEPDHAYSPFAALALLNFGGDFQAAARALIPGRLVTEWPEAEAARGLIEQLVATPDARLVFDAIRDLSRLTPKIWVQVKHAAKALLGERLDLTILERDWQQARRRRPGAPSTSRSTSPQEAESAETFAAVVDAADDDGLAAVAREEDVEEQGLEDRYRMTTSGIWWDKPTKDGTTAVMLTNFTARITREVKEDDGVETRRHFTLTAMLHGAIHTFQIPATQFAAMGWVLEHLGPGAIVLAGMTLKDHARAAIQIDSTAIAQHHLYTHLGWRQVACRDACAESADGAVQRHAWVYLHGAGALGKDGSLSDIAVQLPDGLRNFQLPAPRLEMAAPALVASLQMLTVAPPEVMVPLYGAIWRAPLGAANFSEHLAGQSGQGKTELAVLAQQHYGPALDARHVPATWESTENNLEMLGFHAQDALLLIDDFAPRGSATDVHRYHAKADRVFRGQGNRSGRGRLRPDGTPRPQRPPRGLLLSTGEDIPSGISLRARMAIVEVSPGAVNWERLSACQMAAAEGHYAAAMSVFVQWLAQRYEAVQAGREAERMRLRALAVHTKHRRTPDLVANLALGWQAYLAFAYDLELLSHQQCLDLWFWAWKALGALAVKQQEHQAAEDPVRRYLELIKGALTAGLAHVKDAHTEDAPADASAWGWRTGDPATLVVSKGSKGADATGSPDAKSSTTEPPVARHPMPQGNCIGWLADDRLYLQSDATFRVVQQMADQQHAPLAVSQRTMHRRLYDQGLLRLQESRKQLTVTRHIGPGKRAESVLDVGLSVMTPENSTFSTFSTPEPESQQNQALAEVLFPAWYSPKQHPKQHLDADAEVSPRGGAISVAVSNHQTAPETCSQRLINQWQVLEVLKVLFADVYRAPQDGALYARFNTNGSGWPLARCETTAPPADAPSPPATLTPGLPACAVCGGTERWDNGGTPHCVVCWPPSRASP